FIFRTELDELEARNPNLSVTATFSDPGGETWTGSRGRIDLAVLKSGVQDIATFRAHIFGAPGVMDDVKGTRRKTRAPRAQSRAEACGTVTRDPAAKTRRSTTIAGKVEFHASDVSAPVPADATILEVADDLGVFIDNACRSGTCGSCRARLVSGTVNMAVQ